MHQNVYLHPTVILKIQIETNQAKARDCVVKSCQDLIKFNLFVQLYFFTFPGCKMQSFLGNIIIDDDSYMKIETRLIYFEVKMTLFSETF